MTTPPPTPAPTSWLEIQIQAHATFGSFLDAVSDWSLPTPDTDWDVHKLVSHVVKEQQWVPHLLAGRSIGEARARMDPLGRDLAAEWKRYSAAALKAWESTNLNKPVNLSYDTVPAADYLSEQAAEVIVHSWDLARAIGADDRLEQTLVEAAWSVFEPQQDTLEASGLFASVIPMPADASLQSRLLALTGRDDRIAA